jgi:DHA2 family multidrug resistance protein
MPLFARVLQGAGGGALQPIAQAVFAESFPPRSVARQWLLRDGIAVAPIIGPTLGGWITDNYSWRWIFYIKPRRIRQVDASASLRSTISQNQRPGRIDYIGFT